MFLEIFKHRTKSTYHIDILNLNLCQCTVDYGPQSLNEKITYKDKFQLPFSFECSRACHSTKFKEWGLFQFLISTRLASSPYEFNLRERSSSFSLRYFSALKRNFWSVFRCLLYFSDHKKSLENNFESLITFENFIKIKKKIPCKRVQLCRLKQTHQLPRAFTRGPGWRLNCHLNCQFTMSTPGLLSNLNLVS